MHNLAIVLQTGIKASALTLNGSDSCSRYTDSHMDYRERNETHKTQWKGSCRHCLRQKVCEKRT